MAAAAAAIPALAEEDLSGVELEVAAILCGLCDMVETRRSPPPAARGIPKWGRRQPRSVPAQKPPADELRASPDTPLEFPGKPAAEAAAQTGKRKASTHDEWMQEQRGVVAGLSMENTHLSKEIEDYRARLQSSRGANESLKEMHSQLEQRRREEEEDSREPKVQAAVVHRPPVELDLNAPPPEEELDPAAAAMDLDAPETKPTPVPEWHYLVQRRVAATEARRRRQEIRRLKMASSPFARRPRPR